MSTHETALPELTDPAYLRMSAEQAELEVRRRSVARSLLYPMLYLAILGVTPILHRYRGLFLAFGGGIAVTSGLRLFLAAGRRSSGGAGAPGLFALGVYATGLLWGVFCALTVAYFELGWTSFFVMLVTCGIAAGEMAALSPRFTLLWRYLLLMLSPTFLASLFLVGGQKGVALGLFFGGFLLFLLLQGRVETREYWARLRENARLSAMIDALPGTVAWVTSQLRYVGVNRRLAELWKRTPAEFTGQKLGFITGAHSPLIAFAESLFSSGEDYRTLETKREILGESRSYYLFGQKYNFGSEAILLGLDMTERKETEAALLHERAQRLYTARLANLGQVFGRLCMAMEELESLAEVRGVLATLRRIATPAPLARPEPYAVSEVIGSVTGVLGAYARKQGVGLLIEDRSGSARVEADFGQLLEVILSLVNNSFDALEGAPEKKITVTASRDGQEVEISVTDSGHGIPGELAEKVFEPLFTTREEGFATGVGLSISKEIVEGHGGRLYLDTASGLTRFVIRLPLR